MSKNIRYACYGITVNKTTNEVLSVTYKLMNYKKFHDDGSGILISPERRTRIQVKLSGSTRMKAQSRADHAYILPLGPTSMTAFKVDVMTKSEEKSVMTMHYANNKEHLIRYAETCYPNFVEDIKAALEVADIIIR